MHPRLVPLCAAVLLFAPAHAATPAPAVRPTGLVKMLADVFSGRAVMGAGVGYAGPDATFDAEDLKRADTLLSKL